MKQSCVSAFARAARTLTRSVAVAAVALVGGAFALHAQSTGKVEGRVRDQAGAPIANAQVIIVGTAFNAQTNAQGYYFINNVPVGTVTMRAAFVGYRPVAVQGLRVMGGQTVTQDFTLERSVVEIEDVTVTAAAQPLVPRDEVTTKQRIDGEFTNQLPVDRVNQVLALQPGVVASASGNTLSIRGGRTDEAATYIDGVPTQRGARGGGFVDIAGSGQELSVSTAGVEEASVTTGAASSEFGNAQSGIIALSTRTGSATEFNGSLGFETDEVFGNSAGLGFNRLQASFGGPLRFLPGLTFFVGGDIEGQKSFDPGIGREKYPLFVDAGVDTVVTEFNADGEPFQREVRAFAIATGECDAFASSSNPNIANNYGQDCTGIRVPTGSGSSYRMQGRLNYSYGTGSRLSVSLLNNQNQSRVFSYNNLYNPQNQFGNRAWNRALIVNWTQNLSKSAERAFAIDAAFSYQLDRYIRSPFAPENVPGTGTLGFYAKPYDFLYDFDSFSLDSTLIANYRANRGYRAPILPEEYQRNPTLYNTVDAVRNNAYALDAFTESGGPVGRIQLMRENRTIGRAAVDWQADRYNRLRFGGEFTKYHIENFSHQITSQAFSDAFIEDPIRYAAFIEDRLDLGDVVLQAGLRYDAYNSRAERPYTVTAAGDTIRTVRISSHPDDEENQLIFLADQRHDYVSPHVQVSFPVTDKTNFRLSYAHQVQAPDFGLILGGINTDLGITNTNNVYGSDLDFGKTITFEFGIRHAFNDDMVLDLAAYNKDNLSNAAGRLVSMFDPLRGTAADIRLMTNADFGNTRGIDVRLDRRIGQLFNGTISYSFQDAKNTGTDPFTYINFGSRVINQVSGGNQPPPQAIAPTAFSRPHSLSAAASVSFPGDWQEGTVLGSLLQDFGVFTTFRYSSGTAYTLCPDEGNQSVVSGQVCAVGGFEGGLNTARLPSFKELNMRFTKGFQIGGLNATAYLDARNILNFRNVLAVFVQTRDIVNPEEFDLQFSEDLTETQAQAEVNNIWDDETHSVDLTFGGQGASGCDGFIAAGGQSAVADCVYMVRAEQRFGNGDGVYTEEEQRAASQAFYLANARGENFFLGNGRRLRLGLELSF